MRPIHRDFSGRALRGVTLLEMVVAIVLVGIIIAAAIYFIYPVRQSADLATRAELSDIADNALQRIGREVRLALPNSVRVDNTTVPGSVYLEFLALRAAGRYRSDIGSVSTGTDCVADGAVSPPDADQLSFDVSDGCFKSLGEVLDASTITTSDFIVLNNYGPGFTGQNAYEASAANLVQIGTRTVEAGRLKLEFASKTFQRTLHDSPGKRFFVISGPVTFECNTSLGQINRYSGYGIAASQPTPTIGGARIADNVLSCDFDYSASGVAPQIGLLTLRLTLRKALSGGATETVRLYHAVHVNNVP
jgi:MSHA biogenesis protein MshO